MANSSCSATRCRSSISIVIFTATYTLSESVLDRVMPRSQQRHHLDTHLATAITWLLSLFISVLPIVCIIVHLIAFLLHSLPWRMISDSMLCLAWRRLYCYSFHHHLPAHSTLLEVRMSTSCTTGNTFTGHAAGQSIEFDLETFFRFFAFKPSPSSQTPSVGGLGFASFADIFCCDWPRNATYRRPTIYIQRRRKCWEKTLG